MLWESEGGWDDFRYQSSELDWRLLELELLNPKTLNPFKTSSVKVSDPLSPTPQTGTCS